MSYQNTPSFIGLLQYSKGGNTFSFITDMNICLFSSTEQGLGYLHRVNFFFSADTRHAKTYAFNQQYLYVPMENT